MVKRKRNYRKEYDDYHGTREQKIRRADRNVRGVRRLTWEQYIKVTDKELDHTGSHRTGRLRMSRLRVTSRTANRKRQPKRS